MIRLDGEKMRQKLESVLSANGGGNSYKKEVNPRDIEKNGERNREYQ